MFCPKCGTQLVDEARFCGSCGTPVRTASTPQAAVGTPFPAALRSSAEQGMGATGIIGSLGPLGIAARAVGVVAIIGMFLPWLSIPVMDSMNGLASIVGQSVSSEFTVFGIGDLLSASGAGELAGIVSTVVLIAWLIGLALLAAGLIVSLAGAKKSTKLMISGAIVVAVLAIVWIAVVAWLNGQISSSFASGGFLSSSLSSALTLKVAVGTWITLLCGAACAVMGVLAQFKSARI